MNLVNKVIVVTGAAQGIGRALCERFLREQPRAVLLVDRDAERLHATAHELDCKAAVCNVEESAEVERLVAHAEEEYGQIDLFCANAGIAVAGGVETADEDWERILNVNFMSHVYAARAVLPGMLQRGEGHLLHTASAAGLLTQLGSAPYSVSKHAVVSLAEWLAITYGDRGIGVSCLCPQGVRTRMLDGDDAVTQRLQAEAIEPATVAESVVQGLQREEFLILPHPEVAEYFRRKANDYDRWLRGMRKLQRDIDGPAD